LRFAIPAARMRHRPDRSTSRNPTKMLHPSRWASRKTGLGRGKFSTDSADLDFAPPARSFSCARWHCCASRCAAGARVVARFFFLEPASGRRRAAERMKFFYGLLDQNISRRPSFLITRTHNRLIPAPFSDPGRPCRRVSGFQRQRGPGAAPRWCSSNIAKAADDAAENPRPRRLRNGASVTNQDKD